MEYPSAPGPAPDVRARVLGLLRQYGWNATSFQILEEGFRYWFNGADACVAYVETSGAWVVAGAPICAREHLAEVTDRFVAAARAAGRRAAFFAIESRGLEFAGLEAMQVGEQPVWDPSVWPDLLQHAPRLREQLRRAQNGGVSVRLVAPEELVASSSLRVAIETLIERWQRAKAMAQMGFLVAVQPFDFAEERRYFVAERGGRVLGFLAAVPIYGRDGWLLEDFLREPGAPNGSVELLIDAAMRALGKENSRYVTLGLAPLSGPASGWLRVVRRLSATLYDFGGLYAFKAKLRPHAWEPVFLGHPRGSSSHVALVDALAAFARGSLVRFGGATLLRGPALVVRVLAALLVPWTALLACADQRWFPEPWMQKAWIAFDVVLVVTLLALTLRWRHWLGVAVATAISGDAGLTATQVALYDAGRAQGHLLDWLVIAISMAGPTLAAVVLWGAVGHRRELPRAS